MTIFDLINNFIKKNNLKNYKFKKISFNYFEYVIKNKNYKLIIDIYKTYLTIKVFNYKTKKYLLTFKQTKDNFDKNIFVETLTDNISVLDI